MTLQKMVQTNFERKGLLLDIDLKHVFSVTES